MPCRELPDGLYLVKQRSPSKGVDHYGIVDIGNRLGYGCLPAVIHQTPPGIRVDWLEGTGVWNVLGRIADEAGAIERIRWALRDPRYDVFGHNCEHFARFVATARRESTQLQGGLFMAGLIALVVWGARREAA